MCMGIGGYLYLEGVNVCRREGVVEWACMGRGCVYGRGGICVFAMNFVHLDGWSVFTGRGCVYTKGVEYVCMGRGRMCVYERVGCVHGKCVYV